MNQQSTTIRLKVSPRVARLIAPEVSAEEQRQAVEGTLPLSDGEQLTAWFLLAHRGQEAIRALAVAGLRKLPADRLTPLLEEDLPPQLLHFIVRCRLDDVEVMAPLLARPDLDEPLLLLIAGRACPAVLALLVDRVTGAAIAPELDRALAGNPAADAGLLARFNAPAGSPPEISAEEAAEDDQPGDDEATTEDWEDGEDEGSEEVSSLSKFKMTMHMGVGEKVKAALTGDKEWRTILILDTNRLVSASVLKNPRITEGEVLAVAKNKSTQEELIRIITQNREWMKNYAIKQALVVHPRVPLVQALRYMSVLSERDLKLLAKSRDVSQAIVNNARRMLNARQQRR
jgi:hypothetical protein